MIKLLCIRDSEAIASQAIVSRCDFLFMQLEALHGIESKEVKIKSHLSDRRTDFSATISLQESPIPAHLCILAATLVGEHIHTPSTRTNTCAAPNSLRVQCSTFQPVFLSSRELQPVRPNIFTQRMDSSLSPFLLAVSVVAPTLSISQRWIVVPLLLAISADLSKDL